MSWWVSICDVKGKYFQVERFSDGGTLVLGGSSEASLNITYNYAKHYYRAFDELPEGLRSLDGMDVIEALPHLAKACKTLPDSPEDDYWKGSEGNAGHALHILKQWCKQAIRSEVKLVFSVD